MDIEKEDVVEVIKTIIDPELYIDIWTLGLIYGISIQGSKLHIKMTFTSMACPAGPMLVEEIRQKTMEAFDEIEDTDVEVVFEPQWQPSEELKMMLGIA